MSRPCVTLGRAVRPPAAPEVGPCVTPGRALEWPSADEVRPCLTQTRAVKAWPTKACLWQWRVVVRSAAGCCTSPGNTPAGDTPEGSADAG